MIQRHEAVIVGAGLTGLAAGSILGSRAVVLERDRSPGGLVRSERIGAYWFDHVIHLLYFQDPATEARIRSLLGEILAPCPAVAWVETAAGCCRFPIQRHLGGLEVSARARCIEEMARLAFGPVGPRASSVEENLLHAFGPTLCELFMLPYNRKMWKRPLDSISHRGLSWNLERPDFGEVVLGAIDAGRVGTSYNAKGHYPRPPVGFPVRGMEVLSRALAASVPTLMLGREVKEIDIDTRIVAYADGSGEGRVGWNERLLSTIPFDALAKACPQLPAALKRRLATLRRNRVVSVFMAIEGPRPEGTGLWRYYADESLCFTRLVFMHEFDPRNAPPEGWGLLAEVTQRAEDAEIDGATMCRRVMDDARRVGILRPHDRVVGIRAKVVDPAYVVLAEGDREAVDEAMALLGRYGVNCRGRYGTWKYSGMSESLREGFEWAAALTAT